MRRPTWQQGTDSTHDTEHPRSAALCTLHCTAPEGVSVGNPRRLQVIDAHGAHPPLRVHGRRTHSAKRSQVRVRIPEQANKYPANLSGGQQQRVAIARSLCMEPSIMLFDEPTSALDPEMINEVLDVMTELATSGITMICVTHETGFARRVADKMVFMDLGEIVEMAEPEKFFSAPESPRCRDFLDKILHH